MAFDLTKPSAAGLTFAGEYGNIRENFRAIVQGDSGVFAGPLLYNSANSIGINGVANGAGYPLTLYSATATQCTIPFFVGGTVKTYLGVAGGTNDIIVGSALGDLALRTQGGGILFSINSGSTYAFVIGSAGVGINGPGSGGYKLTVTGAPATLHTGIQVIGSTTAAAFINVANTSGNMQLGVDSSAGGNYGSAYGSFAGSATATNFALIANNLVRLLVHQNGNVVMGTAALATNATDGFFYGASCAGTPTGAPTAFTGRVPMIYDTTNNKLYVYNGAWKSVTLT
jgi:hypothetical protein